MLNMAILVATVAVAAAVFHPRLAKATLWRASITPLASIIGSGFLVIGPILEHAFGALAPFAMAALCLLGWFYGAAIRFNMRMEEHRTPGDLQVERIASISLAFAYVISTAYYLNLFGAFGVSLTPLNDAYHARLLTSAMLCIILLVGWFSGFGALERMEQVAVGVKLAVIAALLVGLAWQFGRVAAADSFVFNPVNIGPGEGVLLVLGLIVTVQGFETSRYLGETYDTQTRIRSMKLAQLLAGAVYMAYILLLSYLFEAEQLTLDETGIIELMRIVAPILPVLLVAAALAAQFSAAVADTGGAGGLVHEFSQGFVSPRVAYAVLIAIGLALTWTANVFEIISYASRAFAIYYGFQAAIAARLAARHGETARAAGCWVLVAIAVVVTLFAEAVE